MTKKYKCKYKCCKHLKPMTPAQAGNHAEKYHKGAFLTIYEPIK